MTREQAEKIVWDFAGLNREIEALSAWGKAPSKDLNAKVEELAKMMIDALIVVVA